MKLWKLVPLVFLVACGDDGATSNTDTSVTTSDVTSPSDTVDTITPEPGKQQGTAATGAPIANAAVTGVCADGSTPSGTTDANGNFTLDVEDDALPCTLTVASTPELHSLATAAGIANITPLTDLVLARAVSAVGANDLDALADALVAQTDVLRAALVAAGYPIPASWTAGSTAPFTTPFVASPANDPYDQLLEAFAAGLDDANLSYADALSAYVSGATIPSAVIDPNDLPLTGDGAALGGADGATGTVDGTTYTHEDGVQWGYLPQFGVDTGAFMSYGPGPAGIDALTGWRIGGFKAEVGTYTCKSFENDTTRIQLLLGGGAFYDTAPDGGACKIEILSISPSAVTGRFSAVFVDPINGGIAGTVTDGYFFKKVFDGGGEALPEGEVGVSFDMDGQTWRYASASSLAFEAFAGMSSAPPDGPGAPIGIQIHTVPNAVGTYECDTDPNSYRQLNIWFVWDFLYYKAGVRQFTGSGPAGSRCKITVTKVGASAGGKYYGTFEGTFEGTFVTDDLANTKVVTNGKFRLIGETYVPPEYLTAMAGSYAMKVTQSAFSNHAYGSDLAVTIAADGTITIGEHVFTGGQYSADPYLQSYNREPGILITRGDGTTVRLGVPDGTHLQYVQLLEGTGDRRALNGGVRPISDAMVDALEDLAAGAPYTLRLVQAGGFDPLCATHELTMQTTTIDPMDPYVKYSAPGATDGWGDSSRLSLDGGDVVLTNYYSRLFFRANGSLELRSLGGSFQEYDTWTNDPAAISAAGCE